MSTVLVYRDRLLAKSEWAFMRRQYLGFETLKPQWVGCRLDSGLAESGIADPLLIGGRGALGPARRALFKQFGVVPELAPFRALAPAIVHAQFGRGGALALPLAQALNLPLVVTFHGGDAFKDKHYRRGIVPAIFQRRWPELQRYAALFVCVSEGVRAKLLARGAPAEKLEVINIGVELTAPAPAPAASRAREKFLFAGRFVEKKGIFVLLDAIRQFRALGHKAPFVLAGDGPLLAIARAKAADLANVSFPGWLSPDALHEEMASAIALVVPSIVGAGGDAEGLASVAVEAMSFGVPVIASDTTGLEAFHQDGEFGVITPSGDRQKLYDALALLSKSRERAAAMGANAAQLVQRRLSAATQSRLLESRLLAIAQQNRL